MDNFQSITASPEALAAFLGSIPAIETPWDEAFHRLCCSSCSAADCDDCRRSERDNPLWRLGLPAAKVIEEIQKRACSECPAAEYCKNSPLNFCTEVLYAWAKEEAL